MQILGDCTFYRFSVLVLENTHNLEDEILVNVKKARDLASFLEFKYSHMVKHIQDTSKTSFLLFFRSRTCERGFRAPSVVYE